MLIADCLQKIYYRFEKSSDAPEVDSDDYIIRLEYCNAAINKWENEIGTSWKELFKQLSGTLVNGVFDDATSLADFNKPEGFLWIGSEKYEYVRPERVEKEVFMNPSKKIYTVTGAKGTKSINVYPAISDDFTLNYRKFATQYTTGEETEEIEMSDPEFVIYDVLANLYLEDDNTTQAGVMSQIASQKMDAMRLSNDVNPFNIGNAYPDDEFGGLGN